MKIVYWTCFFGIVYAYAGYPLVLSVLAYLRGLGVRRPEQHICSEDLPTISVLIPVHNEEDVIGDKIESTLSLYYPGQMEVIVVSDGSTDSTAQIVGSYAADKRLVFLDLPERKGKANALNAGMKLTSTDVIVFTDASIILNNQAIWEAAQAFSDPKIGCVSGEDRIDGGGGEGLYGKYELFVRRKESALGSIVGASGSFYAQRRALVTEFPEGLAPDFVSVLNTARKGYRAVSTPRAYGHMTAVKSLHGEFARKVRTVVRGMTALFSNADLMNPLTYPGFSFFLLSHKVMRWCVPILMLGLFLTNILLIDNPKYLYLFVAQLTFYAISLIGYLVPEFARRLSLVRFIQYFTVVNLAIAVAWLKYLRGDRQEIWGPSKRAL